MTTRVAIENLGPDAVKVETVIPDSDQVTNTLHVLPGHKSTADLCVYDGQIVRVTEDVEATPKFED